MTFELVTGQIELRRDLPWRIGLVEQLDCSVKMIQGRGQHPLAIRIVRHVVWITLYR